MTVGLAGQSMAKRNDVTVKIDADVVRMAKLVADFEDKHLAEYVSEILRPIVERDLERHAGKFLEGRAKAKGKAKGGDGV